MMWSVVSSSCGSPSSSFSPSPCCSDEFDNNNIVIKQEEPLQQAVKQRQEQQPQPQPEPHKSLTSTMKKKKRSGTTAAANLFEESATFLARWTASLEPPSKRMRRRRIIIDDENEEEDDVDGNSKNNDPQDRQQHEEQQQQHHQEERNHATTKALTDFYHPRGITTTTTTTTTASFQPVKVKDVEMILGEKWHEQKVRVCYNGTTTSSRSSSCCSSSSRRPLSQDNHNSNSSNDGDQTALKKNQNQDRRVGQTITAAAAAMPVITMDERTTRIDNLTSKGAFRKDRTITNATISSTSSSSTLSSVAASKATLAGTEKSNPQPQQQQQQQDELILGSKQKTTNSAALPLDTASLQPTGSLTQPEAQATADSSSSTTAITKKVDPETQQTTMMDTTQVSVQLPALWNDKTIRVKFSIPRHHSAMPPEEEARLLCKLFHATVRNHFDWKAVVADLRREENDRSLSVFKMQMVYSRELGNAILTPISHVPRQHLHNLSAATAGAATPSTLHLDPIPPPPNNLYPILFDRHGDPRGNMLPMPVDILEQIHNFYERKYQKRKSSLDHVSQTGNLRYKAMDMPGFINLKSGATKQEKKLLTQLQENLEALLSVNVFSLGYATGNQHVTFNLSFLTTFEKSYPQKPHIDFDWAEIRKPKEERPMLGFFPLSKEGMFLELWQDRQPNLKSDSDAIPGQLVHIPFGYLLIMSADTVHAGGFRTVNSSDTEDGNLRGHLYIYKHGGSANANSSSSSSSRNQWNSTINTVPRNIYHVQNGKGPQPSLGNYFKHTPHAWSCKIFG